MADMNQQDDITAAQKEQERNERLYSFEQAFEDFIPLEQLVILPKLVKIGFGSLAYAILIGCFLYSFIVTFLQRRREAYIALDDSEGICSTVERSITATYYATSYGSWQGDKEFLYSQAIYSFDFFDLRSAAEDFTDMIEIDLYPRSFINALGRNALTDNLVWWMHFKREVLVNNKKQVLSLTTRPADVFNRRYMYGYLKRQNETCFAGDTTFEPSQARFRYIFPDSPTCRFLIEPLLRLSLVDTDSVSLSIDGNTLSVMMAVNQGILSTDDLERVNFIGNEEILGSNYKISVYVDPRYQGSEVITCGVADEPENAPVERFCLNEINNYVMLPIMFHTEYECNLPCEQQPDSSNNNNNNDYYYYYNDDDLFSDCSSFSFVLAVIYSTIPISNGGLDPLVALLANVPHSDLKLSLRNDFYSDYGNFTGTLFATYCGSCTVLYTHLLDEYNTITPFGFPLKNGNCADDIIDSGGYKKLSEESPESLTEKYYECKDTIFMSFLEAAGIAFGNMEVFGTFGLIAILISAFMVTKYCFATYQPPAPQHDSGIINEKLQNNSTNGSSEPAEELGSNVDEELRHGRHSSAPRGIVLDMERGNIPEGKQQKRQQTNNNCSKLAAVHPLTGAAPSDCSAEGGLLSDADLYTPTASEIDVVLGKLVYAVKVTQRKRREANRNADFASCADEVFERVGLL